MYRHLPNQLTLLRLVLAGVFFISLNQYRYTPQAVNSATDADFWLLLAISLFLLAAVTDALDGYLARKWHVESTFGRIMDPFCDKVLILGAFIYLAGPRFAVQIDGPRGPIHGSISGVYPWMVAIILARELLVTAVRGELESAGVHFGSNIFGKAKMILQSAGVPLILVIVWLDPIRAGGGALTTCLTLITSTIIIVTVISGLPYLLQSRSAFRTEHS